ncbi:unnamed protein product [Parnassius mnemosyne]|uniref:FP protein C-terminal domain-containing protein n=1 Tax=Parnassius mnemosyne TaxID=213953 RepID=A0AAV1MCC7_9NEOP
MTQCDQCNKNITKTRPGVECNRCEKLVHLSTACAGLTNKQVSALRATDSLEWTCQDCHNQSPKRRSIVVPEDDDDEPRAASSAGNFQIDIKNLLEDISKEMQKTIRREIKDIHQTLQFHTEKVDEAMENLEACQKTIIELKKKNIELTNKNSNLETRLAAIEQRMQDMEQHKLAMCVDIVNLTQKDNEDPMVIAQEIAGKLKQPTSDVIHAERLPGKKEHPGPIRVQLKSQITQDKWLETYKQITKKIPVPAAKGVITEQAKSDVETTSLGFKSIIIREALTAYNKHLLWNAKQELKSTFKYIWMKKGVLRVRKEGQNEKPIIIHSINDIKQLRE